MWYNPNPVPPLTNDDSVDGNDIVSDEPTSPPRLSDVPTIPPDATNVGDDGIVPVEDETSAKTEQSSESRLSTGQRALVGAMVAVVASLAGAALAYQYQKSHDADEVVHQSMPDEAAVELDRDQDEGEEQVHHSTHHVLNIDAGSHEEV